VRAKQSGSLSDRGERSREGAKKQRVWGTVQGAVSSPADVRRGSVSKKPRQGTLTKGREGGRPSSENIPKNNSKNAGGQRRKLLGREKKRWDPSMKYDFLEKKKGC